MMPVRLTMTAFGPYKDKEVIDFAELSGNRLFLVSGNTGAGKTSIFDAICFALYGEASGEDRSDVRMLRSQFASDDLYTSVEFEFELKRRTYRILRQLPHVKTGNKSATGEKYEFVETTGDEETMMVDRHAVRQINERMQMLLGLTKDQFSQIVMLPQGEFRKLLTSDTENKEEIMRRIFRTHLFKFVAEYLNEKRKASQSEWELARRDLDMHAANLKLSLAQREDSALARVFGQEHFNVHQVLEALDEEMAYYEGEKAAGQVRLDEESRLHKTLVERYHAAARVNELYGELDRKSGERHSLEASIPEVEEKKRRLALAEKTLPLEVRERLCESAQAQARAAEGLRQSASEASARAAAELAAAQERHAQEEGRAGQREALVRELERLARDLPTVRELEERRVALGRLEREAAAALREQQAAEAAAAARQEALKALAGRARQTEEAVRELPGLSERFERMLQEATLLREYVLLVRAAALQAEEEAGLRLAHEEAAKRYLALEAGWLEGQAGQLAAHLHDGKPCPVCGSEAHPRPAEPPTDMPTREALDRQRADKAERETLYLAAKTKREHTAAQLRDKAGEIDRSGHDPGQAEAAYAELVENGKRMRVRVDGLRAEQDALDELRRKLAEEETALEAAGADKERRSAVSQERRTAYAAAQAVYDRTLAGLPEGHRTLEDLQRLLREAEQAKERLDAAWRIAQEQLRQAGERHAAAMAHLDGAERQLNEAKARLAEAQGDFAAELARAGFASEADYRAAKLPERDIADMKAEIERFMAGLAAVVRQIEELVIQLQGKERADLAALAEEAERMERQAEATRLSLREAQESVDKGAEGRANLLEAESKWRKSERDFQLVKDLYDVVRGDNRHKISFERYLLVEFLDRILSAANLRLRTISGGQFYLVRSDRREKHGKQSGLGLDVFDNYTGQLRDVKTLSGGEKFNASLCLALGMADVIQAYEGGVSLETMFIDEGFGSLDEESLSKAVDTLVQLQQTGRMIGIISHVQELKQAIPAVLEVKKSADGCSYTKFRIS
ncbi:AAA family ATPase [Cohnella sp. GCM10020058]|uniref:AAA family ATPase n=1 Tax=Cohnella sp. GCM10020058 TaxID=3317330 RepID=UPI003637F33A